MNKKTILIIYFFFSLPLVAWAQGNQENLAWLASFNSIKINTKWGIHTDVQWRSQNNYSGTRNLLFRPGISYFFNANNQATLGYLFVHTENAGSNTQEHRIWQQFIHVQKISKLQFSHRFRLEQRFLDKDQDNFSQRFRYFIRTVLPLEKQEGKFEKGLFAALQNELFFNIQHQKATNGKFFDQNRAFIGLGYRLNKSFDVELGYLDQQINGTNQHSRHQIMQLACYARF